MTCWEIRNYFGQQYDLKTLPPLQVGGFCERRNKSWPTVCCNKWWQSLKQTVHYGVKKRWEWYFPGIEKSSPRIPCFFLFPPGNFVQSSGCKGLAYSRKEHFAWVCDHTAVVKIIILYHLLCKQHPFSMLSKSSVVLFPGNRSVLSFRLTSDKSTSSSWIQTAAQGGCSLGWEILRTGGGHKSQTLLNTQKNVHGFW